MRALILLVTLYLLSTPGVVEGAICNVLNYGAKPDNSTDVGPAILSAYKNCAASSPASTILIPSGNYLLNSIVYFRSVSNFILQLDGYITIKFNTSLAGTLFEFYGSSEISFQGNGTIDGQGNLWRPGNDLSKYPSRPRLIRFENSNKCRIFGLTLINSPMFHITVIGDNNELFQIKIIADNVGETDGFDISGNNNYVHDVEVTNGDECVTVKTPTNGFIAKNIVCHFTAGCQMGSFGNGNYTASVQNVLYQNVTMINSQSGAQIKTYPNNNGLVKNITYDGFNLVSVLYPISINLFWCPHTSCPDETGSLSIQDVTFRNFKGSEGGNSRPAVLLDCLAKGGCKNINFYDISVKADNGKETFNTIKNACGNGLTGLPAC